MRGSRENLISPTVNLTSPWWLLSNENEALATESGRYNPNISDGGNAIYHPEFSEAGSEATVGKSNTELGRHRLWALNQRIKETETGIRRTALSMMAIIIIGIQPLGRSGQRPEFSQATGMALVHCILGKFLGVVCHCFPPGKFFITEIKSVYFAVRNGSLNKVVKFRT